MHNDTENLLPYGDVAPALLQSIFKALNILCEVDKQDIDVREDNINGLLYDCFEWIEKKDFPRHSGKNPHLTEGFPSKNKTSQPRIVKLTKLAFSQLKKQENASNIILLPSPLKILLDILTVPDEPHSRAYALITCRSILFEYMRIYPKSAVLPENEKNWSFFTADDISKAYSEIRTYPSHRDNYAKPISFNKALSKEKLFLAHYLAMKGVLNLRFGIDEKKNPVGKEEAYKHREKYCQDGNLIGEKSTRYEFRLSHDYKDFPDISEFINQIWGIPIPIRNADVIFCGAMKPSSDGGLVISAHGKAGTGKTSLALAMAASLAPLGTKTYYITFEEQPDDLRNRLHSLIPSYLRKLSFFKEKSDDWFLATQPNLFDSELPGGNLMKEFSERHLNTIKEVIQTDTIKAPDTIPKPCPLIVVIDGVSLLCNEEDQVSDTYNVLHDFYKRDRVSDTYKVLHNFIKKCRELKVLVLLLSGEEDKMSVSLDYLVDTVIKLNYEGTHDLKVKPVRIFNLIKTRQQASRIGAHIFHMSDGKGFRIAPQLPSQLDNREKIKRHQPDQNQSIDVFNEPHLPLFKNIKEKYLDIYPGSQILIHGHGSSGKAGLALKILMTPPKKLKDEQGNKLTEYKPFCPPRRILVVSFLYSDSYYKNLESKLRSQLKEKAPSLEILSFYPGFYTPEHFLSKIILKLEKAVLEGEPVTGVLLDGLHNVFLQFPSLADNTMVWPMLYNILIRSKVTTVTTFTTFSIAMSTKKEDDELLIAGHKPFLHALVQASDFYVMLDSVLQNNKRVNELYVKSAIGHQAIPSDILIWDREELVFTDRREPNSAKNEQAKSN